MPITVVVIIRSIISFFALLALVRIIGKQQVAQLTFFDYTLGITIGSIAATLSVQVNENTFSTLIGMLVWSILAILLAGLSLKSNWIKKVSEGEATIVIQNGHILYKNLKKIRITIDELLSEMRVQGVFNIDDVEFALFETGGKLSIQKKSQKQPLTPSDINVSTQYDGMPTNLILDGILIDEALKTLKLSKAWLKHQLGKKGISEINEISLAQLDTKGYLHVDLKGEKPCFTVSTKD